jgi:hypothetical protein
MTREQFKDYIEKALYYNVELIYDDEVIIVKNLIGDLLPDQAFDQQWDQHSDQLSDQEVDQLLDQQWDQLKDQLSPNSGSLVEYFNEISVYM